MRAVVVYESMFGNTLIAEAIAEGLRCDPDAQVQVVGVSDAPTALEQVDLVVVGGPTHAWGMSRPTTRRGAPLRVERSGSVAVLEPGAATGPGVREWSASVGPGPGAAAAFDTRIKGPVLFTGRASRKITRRLRHTGRSVVSVPESFLVDKTDRLVPGEIERGRAWGADLSMKVGPTPSASHPPTP
jgi:hypothetical protein